VSHINRLKHTCRHSLIFLAPVTQPPVCMNFMIVSRDISIVLQHWEVLKRHMVACKLHYKIPVKMEQNMARDHRKQEWMITELQTSIRDELHIRT